MVLAEGEEPEVIISGDEGLNEKAVACVDSILRQHTRFREDETPGSIALSGFDFDGAGNKGFGHH